MDWCKWAVKARIRPEIIAFLRFKPALLHDADVASDVNAWPPRSWEMASNVLSGLHDASKAGFFAGTTEIEAQLLEGTIGQAAATELVAFLRLFRELPSIDEILLNLILHRFPTNLRPGSRSRRLLAGHRLTTRLQRVYSASRSCKLSKRVSCCRSS
jgi:hypothetical protein